MYALFAGIWGVIVARDLNLCDRSNVTEECVSETTLTTDEEVADPSE